MKKFTQIFSFCLLLFFCLTNLALADGMVMPHPDYYIRETDQKAVIFHENGVETDRPLDRLADFGDSTRSLRSELTQFTRTTPKSSYRWLTERLDKETTDPSILGNLKSPLPCLVEM